MSDDGKKGGGESPHKLVDLFEKDSQNHRVFWATVGKDQKRKAAARSAWDELDPFLLDAIVFGPDFDLLTQCIARERSRRQAPTTLPQPSTPEAETLPPTPAPVATSTATAIPAASIPPPSNRTFLEQKIAEAQALVPVVDDDEPKQLTFPGVAEVERAAPNLWLRSAIFGVVERGTRESVFEKPLATPWVRGELLFTGPELDQSDLDVMLQMVHLASSQGVVDRPLVFSDKAMLQALGKKYSSGNREWLRLALSRLTSSKVTIREEGELRGREFQFLREQAWDNGRRAVVVTDSALKLFADERYTVLQWEARLSLSTSLSKWLHGFLMSQPSTSNGIGLKLLKELAGVPSSRALRLFKFDLQKAVNALLKLDDVHLGLVEAAIVDGKEGPKLMWKCRPNRKLSLRLLKVDLVED